MAVNNQANLSDVRLRQPSLPGLTELLIVLAAQLQLVLSLFPGIDLLGRGFEDTGFCVVRGPDRLWGGDIRRFFPIPGKFNGIIAGSPCQDFSSARRTDPTGYGREMLAEFGLDVLGVTEMAHDNIILLARSAVDQLDTVFSMRKNDGT